MEENDTLQERMERYLNEELTQEERSAFQAELKANAAFAEQVRNYALARQAIQAEARSQLREQVAQAYQNYEGEEVEPETQQSGGMPVLWRAAAAIALIVGLGIGYVALQSPADPYSEYYSTPGAPSGIRGEADAAKEATALYTNKDYAAAANAFEALANDASYDFRAEARLYAGVCRLELTQALAAIEQLKMVPEGSSSKASANWYLAMGYLLLPDYDQAAEVLKPMAESAKHPHRDDAKKALKSIQ